MDARAAIILSMVVNCTGVSSELQKRLADIHSFRFFDIHVVKLHLSTKLLSIICRMHVRFDKRAEREKRRGISS